MSDEGCTCRPPNPTAIDSLYPAHHDWCAIEKVKTVSHDELVPPPLGDGEYIHIEYLHFDPEDAETGFSNMVDMAYSRFSGQDKVVKLIADPRVWAIHIRRYEQPEQGVHLYDETQPLAKAQNQAYAERKRAEALQKRLDAAVESNHKLQDALDREVRLGDIYGEAKDAVIETLVGQLRLIQGRAQRAQRDAYMLEPSEVFLDAKVNIDVLRESEVRKAKERAKRREEWVDHSPTITAGEGECESCGGPADHSEAGCDGAYYGDEDGMGHSLAAPEPAEARLCVKCGKDDAAHIMWAQRHLPVFAESTTDTPEAEQSPEDICVCGHERHQHYDDSCHQCARDEYDHEFKLAVQ